MLRQQVKNLKVLLPSQKTESNCTSSKKWFSLQELNIPMNKSVKAALKKACHKNDSSNEEKVNTIDNFNALVIESSDDSNDKDSRTANC
eukprot:10636336-Ditylum_brightwellii.AAC.1